MGDRRLMNRQNRKRFQSTEKTKNTKCIQLTLMFPTFSQQGTLPKSHSSPAPSLNLIISSNQFFILTMSNVPCIHLQFCNYFYTTLTFKNTYRPQSVVIISGFHISCHKKLHKYYPTQSSFTALFYAMATRLGSTGLSNHSSRQTSTSTTKTTSIGIQTRSTVVVVMET